MNILVINGSPKSEGSITLQTVKYLEIKNPEHSFSVLHAGSSINALMRDFSAAKEALESADMLLFSYPVYTFLAPSQLHRFIRLMKEHEVDVKGKWASQITTSKHFYDITAHRYIEENCADMGLRVVKGLSADMDDLLTEKGREEAEKFFRYLIWNVENGIEQHLPSRTPAASLPFTPAEGEGGSEGDVVIIADLREDATLAAMVQHFRASLPLKSRVIDIGAIGMKGGCLGCFACASDGTCIYKDGFSELLRGSVQTAEAMVYAFSVEDHSMGPLFKMYDDRQFCNGHRTVSMGTPVAYLVNGDLDSEDNLRTVIEARAEVGGNFLAGAADSCHDPKADIESLAKTLGYCIESRHSRPANFFGVGGMKIFRDLIWLMQGMMRADYKFYKAHGQLDFPQKKFGTMLAMYLVGFLNSPKVRPKIGGKMQEGMLMPYAKLFENLKDK